MINRQLEEVFGDIEKEWPRAIGLHPWEEWKAFRLQQMLPQIEKEIGEIRNALVKGDYLGEHGAYAEIDHAIITLIRMKIELRRRENDKRTTQ